MREKAYKLLALQEGITNRSAKDLIDRGVVYSGGKKILLARALMDKKSKFRVEEIMKSKIIFEDSKIIAVDKPSYVTSEQISKKIGQKLLNRLDKETSGVLLLVKDEKFRKEAVEAFRNFEVFKEYFAWVSGAICEPILIDKPIVTIKSKNRLYSKVAKDGKRAVSEVEPIIIDGRYSKVKVNIKHGRTHQIRVHLKSEGYPIVGDRLYGGREYKRVLLHSHKIALLGYTFESKEPKEFSNIVY